MISRICLRYKIIRFLSELLESWGSSNFLISYLFNLYIILLSFLLYPLYNSFVDQFRFEVKSSNLS